MQAGSLLMLGGPDYNDVHGPQPHKAHAVRLLLKKKPK